MDEKLNNSCGVFDGFNDAFFDVAVAPFTHNSENLTVRIEFNLNSNNFNEWGGIRELQIYADKCLPEC